ncbi:MAG: Cna protein B-type domain protein [Acidobacteria bacterium]|nr:Cna protein B-type domain protein [Acidobacteriota bacterium]
MNNGRLAEIALTIMAIACSAFSYLPRESKIQQPSTGTIAGKVTIDGKPSAGIKVTLSPADKTVSPNRANSDIQTTAGEDGRFRLSGVPAGTFVLTATGGAYVLADSGISGPQGKTIILHEGERLEDIDLVLMRGGVITGRVTDAESRPLIGERVSLQLVDSDGRSRPVVLTNQTSESDDRGIYRLYGLAPGRYRVSLGVTLRAEARAPDAGASHSYYPVTYYPSVTDESQAKIIDIQGSSEVTDIDIVRSPGVKAHTVAGRIVDAESGSPMQEVEFGYSSVTKPYVSRVGSGYRTNLKGEFSVENVKSGRYIGFAVLDSKSDSYSEDVLFEITDKDMRELQIKVQRGSSISGVAVVEGTDDPSVVSQLSNVTVRAVPLDNTNTSGGTRTTIAQDATFHLSGVKQGKVGLMISSPPPKNFSLIRVEQNGIEQPFDILQIMTGETTGVRLVIAYGKGNIRGQIRVQGGTLPSGTRLAVSVVKSNAPARSFGEAQPDPNGRFVITNIPTGDYQLLVRTVPAASAIIRQGVRVDSGKDTEAVIVLDLSK